ncbi:MAG: hypothetical protein IKW91_00765 [Bacteroidaceae bacterium]|nr:hypothetical protein [Bacteroidaceae bacterium]MBR5395860.1 hypothetical protein [Bacteroidaceae bacterium]
MPRKIYKTLPSDYAVCILEECPMAETCLHVLALKKLQKKETYMRLINPQKCTTSNTCKYYRDSRKVTYAFGFTNFQQRMYPAQYQIFMRTLIKKFGRNSYFERRRGETALPPKEQEIVLAALRKAGVKEDMEFDRYQEQINYFD